MSENPTSGRPDRAHPDDPDEIDVPTYRARRRPPRRKQPLDPYQRAGRTAPQVIPPRPEAKNAGSGGQPEVAAPHPHPEPSPATAAPTETLPRTDAPERTPRGSSDAAHKAPSPAGEETMVLGEADGLRAGADAAPLADHQEPVTGLDRDGLGAEESVVDDRRGTLNLGLFLLRVVAGAFFIIQAVGLFFTLGATNGLGGLEAHYAEQGFHYARALSIGMPALALAAGVFLVLGLISPLFSALGLVVAGFQLLAALRGSGTGLNVFSWDAHLWLPLVMVAIMATLVFTGPGTWGLDYSRSWARRPLASSWIFVLVAIVVLGLVWWFGAGVNPLHAA